MVGKICTVCRRCSFVDKQLSYFTYPGDAQRRHEWLKAVDRLDLVDKLDNDKTRGNHRICEVHFEAKYVRKSKSTEGRKFLTKEAFPTLCLDNAILAEPMTTENFQMSPGPAVFTETFILEGNPAILEAEKTMRGCITKKGSRINHEIKPISQEPVSIKQETNPPKCSKQGFEPVQQIVSEVMPEIKIRQQLNPTMQDIKPIKINMPIKIRNDVYIKVQSSPSPPPYGELSEFCESVIKVSKSTQTENKGKLYNTENNRKMVFEEGNIEKREFLKLCSKYLPASLARTIKWKLSSSNKRQSFNSLLFALSVYYSSNIYHLLRHMLSLPTLGSIKYFLIPKTTKLSKNFINAFRCKVSNMSMKEKICSFSVGSILLKPKLYYNIKHDRIIGFHDVNGEQRISPAKYAVLLMVQGILEDWRQLVAYAFISEYDNYPEISLWIDEVLTTLIDIGLDVRTFVSDPRLEFLYASQSRFVTPEKIHFTVNGKDICYIYDAAQLLRIVKNNLKSCDIYYDQNTESNNNTEFFAKLHDLYNVLSAKRQYANSLYKRAFSNKSYQKDLLDHMLRIFKNIKVVRKLDGVDVTENMKFIESFQITINSVRRLYDDLKFLGVKYLLTNRLTHACLNRFFTKLKTDKEECTPRQFNRVFVRSFIFNMLKRPVGDHSIELSLDSEEFLEQILGEEIQETHTEVNQPLRVYTIDYRHDLPEKNAFTYVCSYCYLKCIERHCCDTLREYLTYCEERQDKSNAAYQCSDSQDLDVQNCQMMPPESFTEILMLLEAQFKDYLKPDVKLNSIGQEIFEEYDKHEFEMPCPCFPIDYLKALFIRVRLYYMIRKNNKLLRRKRGMRLMKVASL